MRSLKRKRLTRSLLTKQVSEPAQEFATLNNLSVGSRLVVRSRDDWRPAAVSKMSDERVVLTVCSPTGRTYRLSREPNAPICVEGRVPVLVHDRADDWRVNFGRFDIRW